VLPPKRLTSRFLHRTVAMWGVRLISSGEIIYEARNSLPPGKNSFPGSPGTARFQRARGFPIRGARKMRALSGSVPTPLLLCLENTGWGNQVQLVDTRFTNRSSSVMAGTAMPRSHRGTGVSPVTDWVVYGCSLSLDAHCFAIPRGRRDRIFMRLGARRTCETAVGFFGCGDAAL